MVCHVAGAGIDTKMFSDVMHWVRAHTTTSFELVARRVCQSSRCWVALTLEQEDVVMLVLCVVWREGVCGGCVCVRVRGVCCVQCV